MTDEIVDIITQAFNKYSKKLSLLEDRVKNISDIKFNKEDELRKINRQLESMVTTAVATVPKRRDGLDGTDGEKGRDGRDGRDGIVDYVKVEGIVKNVLPKPPKSLTANEVMTMISKELSSIPQPEVIQDSTSYDKQTIQSWIDNKIKAVVKPPKTIKTATVTSMSTKGDTLTLTMSDGTKISTKLPKTKMADNSGLPLPSIPMNGVVNLSKLRDTEITNPSKWDNLVYDGSNWINLSTSSVTDVNSSGTLTSIGSIFIVDCSAGNITLTMPSAVSSTGTYNIKRIDDTSNTLTITSADMIDTEESIELSFMDNVAIVSNQSQYYIL